MCAPDFRLRSLLRTTALATLLLAPAIAAAAPPAPLDLGVGSASAAGEAPVVKRLPVGRDELTFRGENSSRSFQVYLTPAEAMRTSMFQLGLLNSVVAFPERSSLKLTINGRAIASVAAGSSDEVRRSILPIPPGVLTSGYNSVRIDTALTHRVDCSVDATYELWARLDPAETGFLTQTSPQPIHALGDLRGEPLGADGATHIRLRMPEDATAETIARSAALVEAVVRGSGVPRPIVEVGADAGQGPGFDVVLANHGALPSGENQTIVGRNGDLAFSRDGRSNRLTVILTTPDSDLDAKLEEIGRRREPAFTAGFDGASRSFGELGFSTGPFAGRRYASSVDVELPGDFFSANYDKVQALLDGFHSGSLDRDSGLVFRVNGKVAASLPLRSGSPEFFAHRQVTLPLSDFRPGHNEVAIEGLLTSPLDAQCDVATGSHEARLELAPTSELRFPRLARMATLPRIASAIEAEGHSHLPVHVYIPAADPKWLGTALTTLANIDPSGDFGQAPELHFHAPSAGDPPGLVLAPIDQLPEALADELRKVAKRTDIVAQQAEAPAPVATPAPLADLDRLFKHDAAAALTLPMNYLLIAAAAPNAQADAADARWPRLGDASAQWLIVASSSAEAEQTGVARFTANGGWPRLAGQAVAYDVTSGEIASVEPSDVAYALPSRLDPADIRPIFGGVFSDNIALSLVLFVGMVCLLGLSTHALVRKSGVR